MHQYMRSAVVLYFSFFMCHLLQAQDINAPYSIIGIGDIENSLFNRSSGMANTGISLRSGKSI